MKAIKLVSLAVVGASGRAITNKRQESMLQMQPGAADPTQKPADPAQKPATPPANPAQNPPAKALQRPELPFHKHEGKMGDLIAAGLSVIPAEKWSLDKGQYEGDEKTRMQKMFDDSCKALSESNITTDVEEGVMFMKFKPAADLDKLDFDKIKKKDNDEERKMLVEPEKGVKLDKATAESLLTEANAACATSSCCR